MAAFPKAMIANNGSTIPRICNTSVLRVGQKPNERRR
jgi:hypothetical protein